MNDRRRQEVLDGLPSVDEAELERLNEKGAHTLTSLENWTLLKCLLCCRLPLPHMLHALPRGARCGGDGARKR